jgi:hypothetical protein
MTPPPVPAWFPLAADTAPATVVYSFDGAEAVVLHPLGEQHPTALAARDRLRARGVIVVSLAETP